MVTPRAQELTDLEKIPRGDAAGNDSDETRAIRSAHNEELGELPPITKRFESWPGLGSVWG